MRHTIVPIILLLATVSAIADSEFRAAKFSSGVEQVSLLELYTSEGCSSCPPADRWLSSLKSESGLWKNFVPVALHVDYWNYIGWDDRFSSEAFSRRQRNYIDQGAARVVYTPGMFLDGEEWLDWRRGQIPGQKREDVGDLNVQIRGNSLAIRFDPIAGGFEDLDVVVAVLGVGLETEVRAGENKGQTLLHDFVALDVQKIRMQKLGGGFEADLFLPKIDHDARELGFAAWVAESDYLAPIQSVGGLLP